VKLGVRVRAAPYKTSAEDEEKQAMKLEEGDVIVKRTTRPVSETPVRDFRNFGARKLH